MTEEKKETDDEKKVECAIADGTEGECPDGPDADGPGMCKACPHGGPYKYSVAKLAALPSTGPGKFEGDGNGGNVARVLHEMSMEGVDEECGDVSVGDGWHGLILRTGISGVEHVIVTEDNSGFFTYVAFEEEEKAQEAWGTLAEEVNGEEEEEEEDEDEGELGVGRKFTLHIVLGNDEMKSLDDIADALETTAKKLYDGQDSGRIMDTNGNAVGHFKVEE
jgi:hypothetical protein